MMKVQIGNRVGGLLHLVTYPLGTQKTVSLDFDEEWARESRQVNFKIAKLITFY